MNSQMVSELEEMGRKNVDETLSWWHTVENSKVRDLQTRQMLSACEFMGIARAFLSVQASSASAERLFGDAWHQEGDRRQHADPALAEMLLMIRSYVTSLTQVSTPQSPFLSKRAQILIELASIITEEIQTAWYMNN